MIKFILLSWILLTGCSSMAKRKTLSEEILTKEKINIIILPVKDRDQAKNLIQNKRNLLKMLFEQSRDPYYGLNKWSDECLRGNVIGNVDENSERIVMFSKLYLNAIGSPGFCPGNPDQNVLLNNHILLYCEASKEIREIRFVFDRNTKVEDLLLCP